MNSIKLIVDSFNGYQKPSTPEQEDLLSSENGTSNVSFEHKVLEERKESIQEAGYELKDKPDPYSDYAKDSDTGATAMGNNVKTSVLWDVFLFLPDYMLLKPVLLIWLITTYPFLYLFRNQLDQSYIESISSDESFDTIASSSSDIEDKTELLKHEMLLENTIKSPSSSSTYIMPPPQRLYPLSRNPNKKRKRKTLVLDLDETLIHSLSRGTRRVFNGTGASQSIEVKINNITSLYQVYKRPYCDYFLKEIAKWFDLQIFTASVKEYADPIINWLETDILMHSKSNNGIPPRVFSRRYYRSDCTYRPGVGYIKDLSKFFPREEDLKNVIILDNSPVSYALHEVNAVMIEGWINDQTDRDLLNLLPMLYSLSLSIDVRYILSLRGGEKAFED